MSAYNGMHMTEEAKVNKALLSGYGPLVLNTLNRRQLTITHRDGAYLPMFNNDDMTQLDGLVKETEQSLDSHTLSHSKRVGALNQTLVDAVTHPGGALYRQRKVPLPLARGDRGIPRYGVLPRGGPHNGSQGPVETPTKS